MNPDDPLTELLASWTPRSPSGGLRRSIFGAPPATAVRPAPIPWMAWMTPAAACLLLVTLSIPSVAPVRAISFEGGPATNSPLLAALRYANEQSAQNALPPASFTWTNHVPPPSTTRSTSTGQ